MNLVAHVGVSKSAMHGFQGVLVFGQDKRVMATEDSIFPIRYWPYPVLVGNAVN